MSNQKRKPAEKLLSKGKVGWMDSICFEEELGHALGGEKIYADEEDLRKHSRCIDTDGWCTAKRVIVFDADELEAALAEVPPALKSTLPAERRSQEQSVPQRDERVQFSEEQVRQILSRATPLGFVSTRNWLVESVTKELNAALSETPASEFCRYCGAGIGKFRREGEGTCPKCDPPASKEQP